MNIDWAQLLKILAGLDPAVIKELIDLINKIVDLVNKHPELLELLKKT